MSQGPDAYGDQAEALRARLADLLPDADPRRRAEVLAIALGMEIADLAWPADPFLEIVATGPLIGAGAGARTRERHAGGSAWGRA